MLQISKSFFHYTVAGVIIHTYINFPTDQLRFSSSSSSSSLLKDQPVSWFVRRYFVLVIPFTALQNITQTCRQTSTGPHRLLSRTSLPAPLSDFHTAAPEGKWCHVQSLCRCRWSTSIASRRRAVVFAAMTVAVSPHLLWSAAFVSHSFVFCTKCVSDVGAPLQVTRG